MSATHEFAAETLGPNSLGIRATCLCGWRAAGTVDADFAEHLEARP